ncbi:MAG: hypothetical protein JNL72_06415 [Flavipsychrobacter sp.]|nr:hypothetical protein [Flavipsychrobacter sp.]
MDRNKISITFNGLAFQPLATGTNRLEIAHLPPTIYFLHTPGEVHKIVIE